MIYLKFKRLLKKLYLNKIIIIILTLLLINSSLVAHATDLNSRNKKTVRVAYVLAENFQEGGEGEPKSGYGYEYLKKISYYTGWEYEYVYGSFGELLQKLSTGEIDLMGNVSYTKERDEYINYCFNPQGEEVYYIFKHANQNKFNSSDPEVFNGAKIGVNAYSYQADLIRQWCKEKNVSCEIIEYEDFEQRCADLEAGVIDATVATDAYLALNWLPLLEIGKGSYYFAVSNQRDDILEELNDAMTSIKISNPFYNEDLRAKYFNSTSILIRMLTDSEKAWLDNSPQIRIGYLKDYKPYSYTDKEHDAMIGVVKDLLNIIKEEYTMDYTEQGFDSYPEMLEALHNDKVDVIFPVYGDLGLSELEQFMVTDPITTTNVTVYYTNADVKNIQTVAIDRLDPFQKQYSLLQQPNVKQIEYDNFEDCLQAVIDNKVDCIIRETSRIEHRDAKLKRDDIQKSILRDNVNVSFGVQEGQLELLAILNKGILTIDKSTISTSLVAHSQVIHETTLIDFLREHVIQVLVGSFVVFIIIMAITMLYYQSVNRNKERLLKANQDAERARYESEHDSLTGLLNRKAYQGLKINLKDYKQPYALILLDGDNLKNINDTYGHDIGDLIIQKIAQQLKNHFQDEDYLIRFGGDEFAVFMMDISESEAIAIEEKIKKINYNLLHPTDHLPVASVSAGIAFTNNGYTDELFQKADQALYKSKNQGGKGCVICPKS